MSFSTDKLLQRPPFNLTDEKDRLEFMQLARDLDISLDSFLFGKVYKKECKENPEPYTDEEIEAIAADVVNIYNRTFPGRTPTKHKEYTLTVGAPLVGKSFFMESKLVAPSKVYVDPDRQSLQFMDTYTKLAEQDRKLAYETFRDASNYICNLLMVWAIYKGYSIVHGTTGTNPRVAKTILPTLKKLGYTVHAEVLFAPAESRKAAGIHRNEHQKFYQSTPGDEKGKVAPVFARIRDAVLPFADTANFYWNSNSYWLSTSPEKSASNLRKFATFDRSQDPVKVLGDAKCLDILDALCKEGQDEIPAKQEQDEVVAMFKSWFAKPEFSIKNYLPAFNRRTAIAATAFVGTMAVVASYMLHDKSSDLKFKPGV